MQEQSRWLYWAGTSSDCTEPLCSYAHEPPTVTARASLGTFTGARLAMPCRPDAMLQAASWPSLWTFLLSKMSSLFLSVSYSYSWWQGSTLTREPESSFLMKLTLFPLERKHISFLLWINRPMGLEIDSHCHWWGTIHKKVTITCASPNLGKQRLITRFVMMRGF